MDEDDKEQAQQQEEDKRPEEESATKNLDESGQAAGGNEDEKKEGEDANQIDSGTAAKEEDETAVDDRGQEEHLDHDGSENGDATPLPNPYENDEPLMLEINSKSKSKCLKKVILEKKVLLGSQMLLFK